ncbi:hypothetical protein DUI87_29468 [Hirundo rustica rustica]|uniref:Uncharacterized protein n=1 Tax=Hirundo rustica rustica TaxID=333673 RepID=A0A3M0IZY7_HIRRU|nr:hypothetical protein DUI87_29468 [Hirundo rustica rustica]
MQPQEERLDEEFLDEEFLGEEFLGEEFLEVLEHFGDCDELGIVMDEAALILDLGSQHGSIRLEETSEITESEL